MMVGEYPLEQILDTFIVSFRSHTIETIQVSAIWLFGAGCFSGWDGVKVPDPGEGGVVLTTAQGG